MIELIRELRRKMTNVLVRAVIETIKQDGGKVIVQYSGLADDTGTDVEHLCQYGFRSIPNPGARGVGIAYQGNSDTVSVIVVDDKEFGQFNLSPGDTMVYNSDGTRTIYSGKNITTIAAVGGVIKRTIGDAEFTIQDGEIKLKIGSAEYTFTETGLHSNKNIDSDGVISGAIDVFAGSISGKTHPHVINSGSSAPGPTAPPS